MSAELKATPGPWQRHDTPDYAEIHPAAGKQHSAVALVAKLDDAHLIAAAPALYEALSDMLAFANAPAALEAKASAALALARGEQQS